MVMRYQALPTRKRTYLPYLEREGEGRGVNWEFITVSHRIIRCGRLVFNFWQARFAENEMLMVLMNKI